MGQVLLRWAEFYSGGPRFTPVGRGLLRWAGWGFPICCLIGRWILVAADPLHGLIKPRYILLLLLLLNTSPPHHFSSSTLLLLTTSPPQHFSSSTLLLITTSPPQYFSSAPLLLSLLIYSLHQPSSLSSHVLSSSTTLLLTIPLLLDTNPPYLWSVTTSLPFILNPSPQLSF